MKIKIDGKIIEVTSADKNIVEIAKESRINIPAPCYYSIKKNGCCNACVIEINGKQQFACATKPTDNMEIIFDRPDLINIRKERLLKYQSAKQTGCGCQCDCSSTSNCC